MKLDTSKFEKITSRDNKSLKLIRALHIKKHRVREGSFLAEGVNVVSEALRAGRAKLLAVAESRAGDIRLSAKTEKRGPEKVRGIIVEDKVFASLADTENTQGIIAVCALPRYIYQEDEIKDISPGNPFIPVLEDVSDPGNCGTIIRMSVGLGYREIGIIGDTADPYSPKVVRASSGIVSHAEIYMAKSRTGFLERVKAEGYKILITDSRGATSLKNYEFPQKSCLIFGGEARGVSPEARELADDSLYIPTTSDVESYNVAAAAAIFLYERNKAD